MPFHNMVQNQLIIINWPKSGGIICKKGGGRCWKNQKGCSGRNRNHPLESKIQISQRSYF